MASILKVDELQGVTAAGSILVTGEGNSTTTNLQQGLAKAWHSFNGTGTVATRGSFNVSSLTDTTTGQYATVFTNSMSDGNYSHSGFSEHDGGTHALFATSNKDNNPPSTTKAGIDSFRGSDNTAVDSSQMTHIIVGDLA